MKYWFIIDDETMARGNVFVDCMPSCSTREDAINRATAIWERMTRRERINCDQLYIGYAEPDEDSDERRIFPDYNTMTDIEYIKE